MKSTALAPRHTAPSAPQSPSASPSPSPSPFTPAPDLADLAATISDLLSHGPTDAFAFEHAIAALVHTARTDHTALRTALLPVIDKGLAPTLGRGHGRDLPLATPLRQLHALAANAVWLPAADHQYGPRRGYVAGFELVRLLRRLSLPLDRPPGMDTYALRGPADILTLRLAELAAHIGDPTPVRPVSTPTDTDGWIDADTLVARIAAAESAGWQPWQLDFDQALLRLPENPNPATVRAAHRLVSPAGHRLAGWLRGGRPTLPRGADLAAEPKSLADNPLRSPRIQPLTTLPDPQSTQPGHLPSTLIHLLRRGWYPPRPLADGSCWAICWPTLLPGQPDLIAIAAAWHPRHPDAYGGSCPVPVLTRLAHSTHAHDDGTFAAIARALTSRSPAKRADAAQALARLAASGHFDDRRFAAALATFATRTDRQVLRSVVPALQQVLGRSTADRTLAATIGTTILGWLPAILPPAVDQPLPYTSHLLNLAADALTSATSAAPAHPSAQRAPKPSPTVSAAIEALTSLASRPSRSPVSHAANGLLAALSRP